MKKPQYLNTFLYLFYRFLRVLVQGAFKLYFSKTTIVNRQMLNIDRPTILVSNHPNTLLDPLNSAAYAEAVVFFLANAGVFKEGFAEWFLDNTYAIPVERPQDVQGRPINNEESFARCDAFLTKKGCLYIAPQGVSNRARRIGKVKSGTARIAFSAENKNDFSLDLQILPIGLTYLAPGNFRSEVLINVGQPIEVDGFKSDYLEDPFSASRKLTALLKEKMEDLIVNTEDDEQDALLYKTETILNHDSPLDFKGRFDRNKVVLAALQQLDESDYRSLQDEVNSYFELLEKYQLKDRALMALVNQEPVAWLLRIPGFFLFVYGWINNILPACIPAWLTKKLNLYVGYDSTIKLLSGLITFPLFYILQAVLVHSLFHNPWITAFYFLSLIPSGLFAWSYLEREKQIKNRNKVRQFKKSKPDVFDELLTARNVLSGRLSKLRETAGH